MARDTDRIKLQQAAGARRPSVFRAILSLIAEFRKVTWPAPSAAIRLTIFVLILSAVLGVFFGLGVDNLFAYIITLIAPDNSSVPPGI